MYFLHGVLGVFLDPPIGIFWIRPRGFEMFSQRSQLCASGRYRVKRDIRLVGTSTSASDTGERPGETLWTD
jgi:hypothetical protein